ncbi:MAG: hypothetical protein O7J95_19160, partial [Planctomycetota bacterium]|nr:hypothetical protein [Planctomycetota bacterium]
MKSISFFCVVFVSMLTAFLVATGEVTRWFSGGEERRQLVFNRAPTDSDTSPNMLYFPFYNVELGKLSFTIRAELSQDDLEVKDKFDEIRHLTLRNGSLDIPVYDGLALGSTPAPENDEGDAGASPQQITLTFESAEWQRPPSKGTASKDGMKVALTNGHGTTNDGFSFDFEELLFLYRSSGNADSYEVSSDRPVSIRNQAFELRSPSGLRGKLRGDGIGLESLTFLPPVTAIIDRKRAPFLQYVKRPETLAKGKGRTERDDKDDEEGVDRVVITSQGRLELRAFQPNEGEVRRTTIAFHEDVVIRPETSGNAEPDSVQTRFECQYLELTFAEVARRLVPVKALATWEGGRVKVYFEQKRGKKGYVVDGDRLEWIYRAPPEGPDPAVSPEVGRGIAGVSQATLYGNPTMTGNGSRFQAREALLDLSETRVLLVEVTGRFRIGRRATIRSEMIRSTIPSEVRKETAPGRRGLETRRVESHRGEERETASLPEDWDMRADEVEFFFADSSDDGQKLSHFIARSEHPRGVVVESASGEQPTEGTEPVGDTGQLRLTSNHVTYRAAEKMITFEGTREAKPKFSQGGNHIESNRIRLSLKKDEELAFFEGDVRALIVDTDRLAEVAGSKVGSERTPKRKERGAAETPATTENGAGGRGLEGPVELTAALLTAGLDQEGRTITFLRAKGTDVVPARINSTTGNHFVIEGAELEWNRRDETAIVWGVSPGPTERPSAELQSVEARTDDVVPAPPRLALLEFEGGQLRAKSISFDQKNQTAYLETHVVLKYSEGSTSVEVHAGRAEVEFFGDETTGASGVPGEKGILRDLRKVKAFRAHRSERSPIELIGEHFRAYADEAVWDAATSELRFLGGEKQEIRIANEHFKGPIYAREIVYSVKDDLVTLRGEVEGRLTQRLSLGAPKDSENPM